MPWRERAVELTGGTTPPGDFRGPRHSLEKMQVISHESE